MSLQSCGSAQVWVAAAVSRRCSTRLWRGRPLGSAVWSFGGPKSACRCRSLAAWAGACGPRSGVGAQLWPSAIVEATDEHGMGDWRVVDPPDIHRRRPLRGAAVAGDVVLADAEQGVAGGLAEPLRDRALLGVALDAVHAVYVHPPGDHVGGVGADALQLLHGRFGGLQLVLGRVDAK